jgi:uncharacterized protein YbaP (TraB family)
MNRFLSAALFALALAACGGTEAKSPPPPPAPAHPAMWKVSDPDTTIYLFGTIHLLPKGLKWTTPAMAKAMAASDQLYLEVALDKDPAKLGAVMASLNNTTGLPPLLDRVPVAKRALLKKVVEESKIPMAYLDAQETWAAALTLSSASMAKLDLSYEEGAETQLTNLFSKAGKPVNGLETAAQQLGYFDTLPEAAQRTFLASILDDDDSKARQEFARMIAAWKAGDVRRIALTFDDEMKLSPVLADVLLHKRNANWAAWIGERMKQPGTVFIAVGAGHLAGKGSVEELLAKRGFKVVRVQ